MKRTGFVISLNKLTKDMLYNKGQTCLRINLEGNTVGLKAGRSAFAADAIPIEMPKIGGPSARIDGEMAYALAKALLKNGYSGQKPYFTLSKGDGGWWNMHHHDSEDSPAASIMFVKMNVPNLDEMEAPAIAKRGRKPKSAKTASEISEQVSPESVPELFSSYAQRINDAITVLAHTERKPGRPSSEVLEAQRGFHDFKILSVKALGIDSFIAQMNDGLTMLRDACTQMETALNFVIEAKAAVGHAAEIHSPELPEAQTTEVEADAKSGEILPAETEVHSQESTSEAADAEGGEQPSPESKDEAGHTETAEDAAEPAREQPVKEHKSPKKRTHQEAA